MPKNYTMIRVLFIFFCLLTAFLAGAQTECTCSLVTEKNKTTPEPATLVASDEPACKIESYRLLARTLLFKRELDSSELYINKALKILASAKCRQESYLIFYQMLITFMQTKQILKTQ